MRAAQDPGWEKWKKMEPHRLARYVDPENIADRFWTAPRTGAVLRDVGGPRRLDLVGNLYAHLAAFALTYDPTRLDFTDANDSEQVVRSAAQVCEEGGSCLDLSLIFAGLCEFAGLRPLLVVLREHTLVAVALDTGVADARQRSGRVPGEEELLFRGLGSIDLGAKARLLALVDRDAYVLVECTGVSSTGRLDGPPGRLDFGTAVTAGHRQLLHGDLRALVDTTYFHLQRGHGPYKIREATPPAAPQTAALGARGTERLTQMLETVGVDSRADRWTVAALQRLVDVRTDADPMLRDLLLGTVRSLIDAVRTAQFIQDWMPHVLTPEAMRRAIRRPGTAPTTYPPLHSVADHLDHIALHHQGGRDGLHRWLASFVLHLAIDAGMNVDVAALRTWALDIDAIEHVNDLAGEVRARRENSRARLVVSLHAAVAGDWPESVMAWWLLDNVASQPSTLPCAPSRAGLEAAIRAHLDWADELSADAGLDLYRVDVAVPTGLLLHWQPEDADVSVPLIADYDVVTRWSDRLHANTRHARKRWQAIMRRPPGGCVAWLDRAETTDLDRLGAVLRQEALDRAVGLRYHPESQEPLLRAVLEHSPILLWLDRDVLPSDELFADLDRCWPDVPRGLVDAYRHREDTRTLRPLSGLRAVWDDEEWLRFCRAYAGPSAGRADRRGAP